jgi:hypothetical protein
MTLLKRTASGISADRALDANAIERSNPTMRWKRLTTRSAKSGRSQKVSVLTTRSRLTDIADSPRFADKRAAFPEKYGQNAPGRL